MARRLPGPEMFPPTLAASGRHAFRPDHDGSCRFRNLCRDLGDCRLGAGRRATNLNINFLKKPAARDLVAEARLIKVGNRLAVAEIGIRSDGAEELVAHATGTYSIPAVQ